MERFVKGDVVVLPYPFTDSSQTKRRPALIISNQVNEDIIACQITSRSGNNAIALGKEHFEKGNLSAESYIKPFHIFTIKTRRIYYKVGQLKKPKWIEVSKALQELFSP